MRAFSTNPYEPAHARAQRWKNDLELPDASLERLLRVAQRTLGVKTAVLRLGAADQETPRLQSVPVAAVAAEQLAFCAKIGGTGHTCILEDTRREPAWADDRAPNEVRFYASHSLRDENGEEIGALCLLSAEPQTLSSVQQELFIDFAEMVEAELQRHALATVDATTGLPNRRGFLFTASRTLALRERAGAPAVLVTLELWGEDRKANPARDAYVLRSFARMLVANFRDTDVVARLEGNEFCVLLCPERADDTDIPLERLERAVDAWNASDQNHHPIRVRHHVLEFDAEEDETIDGLLAAAEEERAIPEPPPTVGGPLSLLRLLREPSDA